MKLKEIIDNHRQRIRNCYSDAKTPSVEDITEIANETTSQIRKELEKEIDNMEFPTSPEIQMYSFNKGVEKVVEIIKSFCEEE